MNSQPFVFENFEFDVLLKKLVLRYSLGKNLNFEETIVFDFEFAPKYDKNAAENAFFATFLMAGISYYKTYIPKKISFQDSKKFPLSPNQAKFFEKIYFHGLGEFFYQNQLEPHRIIFPKNEVFVHDIPNNPISSNENLVLIGGGKDSLTTAEILKSANTEFSTLTVDSDKKFETQIKIINPQNHLKIQRKISPILLDLYKNSDKKKPPYNGHVPISSIWAFLSVCVAILTNKKNIILSNEHSANEATAKYFGHKINHQYSKTLEFETDFQHYVKNFIHPDLNYFSFLRPLSELKIAEIFAKKCFNKYFLEFSSCNKNFKINRKPENTTTEKKDETQKFQWCGNCPKCAFVFTIFSPFVEREALINLFDKKNLFENLALEEIFYELCGLRDSKPFECVGEIMEVRKAMYLARKNFPEVERFIKNFPEPEFDANKFYAHSMPKTFEAILHNFLTST